MTAASDSAAQPSVRPDGVPFREAEIDLVQLARNVELFRQTAGNKPVCAELGANAWGHGVEVVVPALVELGIEAFAVTRLDEAARIRVLAPGATVITTQHSASETFEAAAALGVTPAVRSLSECHRAVAAGTHSVVLVEDDGAGVPALSGDQLAAARTSALEQGISVAQSTDLEWAGPELFGVTEDDSAAGASGLHPVLRLWGPVAATKRVGADEGVSYGYTYRTASETTLALVTLGYSDGISRAGGNRVSATVDGAAYPIAGRVAMDAFMVDLGDVAAPALGTPATVLGTADRGEPTARDQGRLLGMSSAEVTTRLTARPRRYGSRETR